MLCLMSAMTIAQSETDLDPEPRGTSPDAPTDGTEQNGNLNTIKQNSTEDSYNSTKNYNGAGSSGMPVSSAIAPSLITSQGPESCLQSSAASMQLAGVGVSRGSYSTDENCERRRDAITLNNLGLKVAAVARICQSDENWFAMMMAATPCPLIRNGKLVVGKNALLLIKQYPDLYIPNYKQQKTYYDSILGVGEEVENEETDTRTLSDRYRASRQNDGN